MPTLSTFFGIIIRMYYDDHPPPHFHAYYGDAAAQVSIDPVEVLEGALPKRALALVVEWATAHQAELLADWDHATAHRPLAPIDPLE